MIVTPLPIDSDEDMLVDFLSLSVQLPIFPITLMGVEFEVDKMILDIIEWDKMEDSFKNFSKISLDIKDVIEILEKRIAQLEL